MNDTALIAMSGGVDSSVAAYLMLQKGFTCIGATMKLYNNEDVGLSSRHTCCSLDDISDARSVAASLGMPYYVFNFTEDFHQEVIERFIDAYEHGRTPNPCIDCNRYMKFERFYRRARELDYQYVVTGHYARIEYDPDIGRYRLFMACDEVKDQSYVLYAMTQDQLAHTLFPLGHLTKAEVRGIAQSQGFINAKKHDSQDICFVPDGKYADFIESYTGRVYPEGDLIGQNGRVMGTHKGIIRYTIGQRKGLGLAMPEPVYVQAIDPEKNTVRVGPDKDLYTDELDADQINLIPLEKIEGTIRLQARIRYQAKPQWASVTQTGDDVLHLSFDRPQRAITPGQSVVLYDGEEVIGGGTIRGKIHA